MSGHDYADLLSPILLVLGETAIHQDMSERKVEICCVSLRGSL